MATIREKQTNQFGCRLERKLVKAAELCIRLKGGSVGLPGRGSEGRVDIKVAPVVETLKRPRMCW